jgi:hypothetical protein
VRNPNCDDCQRLWHEYAEATTAHIKLDNRLKLAALQNEDEKIPDMTLLTEQAGALRTSLREAILEHERTHEGPSEILE